MIVMEAIRPREFDATKLRGPIFFEMSKYGEEIAAEYRKTTTAWKSKRPVFKAKLNTKKSAEIIEISVYTDDNVYKWVDQGVDAHSIVPNPNVRIAPVETYTAQSMPGTLSINSAGGTRTFAGTFFNPNKLRIFWWTGIEARNFTGQIAEVVASRESMQSRFQAVIDKHAPACYKS